MDNSDYRLVYSASPKDIQFTKEHSLRYDDRGYFVWYRLKPKGRIKKRIIR